LGTFEVKAGAKMEIGTGRTVIANTVLNNAGSTGIRIKAAKDSVNGSLIFNNAIDNPVQATVEMYSKSYITSRPHSTIPDKLSYTYYWQFFGIPVKRLGQIDQNLYGAFVRRYNEPGYGTSTSTALLNRLWVQLTNSDVLTNKKGYELSQTAPANYSFAGELYNSDIDTTLSYSSAGQYPGQHILSNPYTSAIRINDIVFDENMDQSVYLYNTGSFAQWSNTNTEFGSSAGQYIAAPKNTAGEGGVPGEIPSMQGFLVRTNVADEGSLYINYNTVKTPNTKTQRAKKAAMTWMRLNLQGATADGDVMWIFSNPETTLGNDNGWDGIKFASASGTPMMYSWKETGPYQINAVPDIHETNISMRAGTLDTEYSLTFDNENMGRDYGSVYFYDKETGDILDVTTSGTKYNFTSTNTASPGFRFQILTSMPSTTSIKNEAIENKVKVFSSNHLLFVDNRSQEHCLVQVYDQPGRLLAEYQSYAGEIKSFSTGFNPGTYIVRTTGSETQSTVVIIR
jgi:hypothetical protein